MARIGVGGDAVAAYLIHWFGFTQGGIFDPTLAHPDMDHAFRPRRPRHRRGDRRRRDPALSRRRQHRKAGTRFAGLDTVAA